MLRRSYRAGLVKGVIIREVAPSFWKTLKWCAIAVAYGGVNGSIALLWMLVCRPKAMAYLSRGAMSVGVLKATVRGERALRYREYSNTHGY